MTRVGTAHFVSKAHAVRYYRETAGYCTTVDAMDAVQRKLAAGEIHLGPPRDLKPGEKLNVIDNGTRYEIEESIAREAGAAIEQAYPFGYRSKDNAP